MTKRMHTDGMPGGEPPADTPMSAMQALLSRRSIRRYTERPVPEKLLRDVLRAAMAAPSAQDQRPWQFVVIRDRALLRDWASTLPGCEMLREAPLAVLVCGDPTREKLPGYWVQDCSACVQNLLLAAHALGLGAVWVAVDFPPRNEAMARALALPGDIRPLALVPLGYPGENLPAEDRYEVSRVHAGGWPRRD